MGLTKKVCLLKNEKYMARPGGLYIFKGRMLFLSGYQPQEVLWYGEVGF
jgi:hypothetical protein